MRPIEIESWASRVLSAVTAGRPYEDSRVELKADFIEPARAARRIAGHANSAVGEPILWLIGVSEDRGVVGVTTDDRSNWYAQVKAAFAGLCPSFQDVVLDTVGKSVVCLVFDTTRAPYLVKNPDGGAIGREVPWREGTSTRSATREEILSILQPEIPVPEIEVLKGHLFYREPGQNLGTASASLLLYVVPLDERQLIIPFHRCVARILDDGKPVIECAKLWVRKRPDTSLGGLIFPGSKVQAAPEVTVRHDSEDIETNSYQAVINRPAMCTFETSDGITAPQWKALSRPSIEVTIRLVSGAGHGITLTVAFPISFPNNNAWGTSENALV